MARSTVFTERDTNGAAKRPKRATDETLHPATSIEQADASSDEDTYHRNRDEHQARAPIGEQEAQWGTNGVTQHAAIATIDSRILHAAVHSTLQRQGNLVTKVDTLAIGGGMANTFLAAQGVDVGKSLCEHDLADTAREIIEAAKKNGCEIVEMVRLTDRQTDRDATFTAICIWIQLWSIFSTRLGD